MSFEEQFYFLWPWLTIALLTIRMRLRTVVIVLLSLITLIAVHRFISYEDAHRWWSLFYRTDTRADSILWGALFAHIWIRGREPKRGLVVAGWVAALFLLGCLPFATQEGPFVYWGGFIAIDFACAVLILAILDGRWVGRRLFELKPFVALGVVSYAFYLWHLPVFFAVRYFDPHWNDVVRVVVAIVVTLSLTVASWFLLERPLTRWGKRLEAKRYATPVVDAAVSPTNGSSPPSGLAVSETAGLRTGEPSRIGRWTVALNLHQRGPVKDRKRNARQSVSPCGAAM